MSKSRVRLGALLLVAAACLWVALWRAQQAGPPTGAIEGTVVDPAGVRSTDGWLIEHQREPHATHPPHIGASASDGGDGRFRIDGLSPGDYTLRLLEVVPGSGGRRLQAVRGDPLRVSVRANEASTATLVFDIAREAWIAVAASGPPGLPFTQPEPESFRLVTDSGEALLPEAMLPGLLPAVLTLHFADVPPGRHVLEFSQAGYEPRRWEELRQGDHVQAELRGSATLVVSAIDAVTAASVPQLDVEVRRPGRREDRPWMVPWEARDTRQGGAGHRDGDDLVVHGLLPGDYELEVRAVSFKTQVVPVTGLRADERRAIPVAFRLPTTVSGVVVDPRGAPVVGVSVGAYEPASREGASDLRFHAYDTGWTYMQPGPWVHSERNHALTDAQGRFTLHDVAPGSWIVRAYRSPTAHAVLRDVDVSADRPTEGLQLVLPDGCWIDGRLELPPGARCERMSITAWPMDGDAWSTFPIEDVPVTAEGSFRIGPFGPGEVELWLDQAPAFEPQGMWTLGQFDPANLSLGRVEIPAGGDLAPSFDLTESFPAHVHVTARIDGQPAAGAWLQLVDAVTGAHLATGVADDSGNVRLGPFFAAAARVVVNDPGGAWYAYGDGIVTPPGGGEAAIAVSVSASPGRVVLRDENGAVLIEEVVCLYHATPIGWTTEFLRTDRDGGLDLTQPPHELRFLHVGSEGEVMIPEAGVTLHSVNFMSGPPWPLEPDDTMPSVEWTTSGPQPSELRLPPWVRPAR